jgi:hypothetical protein
MGEGSVGNQIGSCASSYPHQSGARMPVHVPFYRKPPVATTFVDENSFNGDNMVSSKSSYCNVYKKWCDQFLLL